MNRRSFSARLRYAFDNYMAKGTGALVGGLFLVSLVLVIGIAGVVIAFGGLNDEATKDVNFIQLVWLTLLRTLDPGTFSGDAGTLIFVFGMLGATLGGIVLVATLIGVINAGLAGKLEELRRGRSQVIERED